MTIKKNKADNVMTIALSGRLDTVTAPELELEISNALAGITELILDLEKLDYISSAGLRVLLSTQKTMNEHCIMTVKNVNSTIMEIFEVTGFTDILTIV